MLHSQAGKPALVKTGSLQIPKRPSYVCSFHISMIIIGRSLQGIAISFASVSVTIYNSEMAPPKLRGKPSPMTLALELSVENLPWVIL